MTDDERALIATIVANPDDDLPRLVYADWLEEHHQDERAKIIRVQCEIERLQGQEAELLAKHDKEWGRELYAQGANRWKFHRGFPEEIYIDFDDFLETHPALNAVTPLRILHLAGSDDESLQRLSALPALKQIRSLEFDQDSETGSLSGSYGLTGLTALADSPFASNLRRLDLHSHHIGDEGALRIAGSANFAGLTHLTLSDPRFEQSPVELMMEVINGSALKHLQRLQIGTRVHGANVLKLMRGNQEPPSVSP
jgi:uncharacterized protein (TIGR02996 family)